MNEIFIPYNICTLDDREQILAQAERILEGGGVAYFLNIRFTSIEQLTEVIDKWCTTPDILPALKNNLEEIIRRIDYRR